MNIYIVLADLIYLCAMKFITFSLLLFFSTTILAQISEREISRYQPRRIVSGLGLNTEYIGGLVGIGLNIYAQFRYDDNRQIAGLGITSFFALNSKKFPALEIDFFDLDTINTIGQSRLFSFPIHFEYHYYLISPKYNRLTARIGCKAGPSLQIVNTKMPFPNKRITGPPKFGSPYLGFMTGAVLNFEYYYNIIALTLDLSANYNYINPNIDLFNTHHQIGASVKLGIAFNYGLRNK